jgi:hypothetical protein
MTNFAKTPAGYEFEATYNALEAVYRGSHKLDQRVEALSNPGFDFTILPYPNAGILNAKYLIENFVISMNNTRILRGGFGSYSGTVCAGLNIVLRAMGQLSKSVKLA